MTTPLVVEGVTSLYSLDLTPLDGPILYFCSLADFGAPIIRDGISYQPIPIQCEGFEHRATGAPPQPTVAVSNVYGGMNELIAEYGEPLGCTFIRTRVLAEWLDGGADPNPTAYLSQDAFVVAQKTSHNFQAVTFKLATRADQQGTMLPRRLVLRDVCTHIYRRWNGIAFDYSLATCPYAGANLFTARDVTTTDPAKDQCSRRLSGCRLRFPLQPLPTRAFPSVGRQR